MTNPITLTEYQAKAYDVWKDNGFRGIISAPTASGKTIMGSECARRFLEEYPDRKVIVVTTSEAVADKWRSQLNAFGIGGVEVYTYSKAINKMMKMPVNRATSGFSTASEYKGEDKHIPPQEYGLTCDCMIADECHHLANEGHGKVMRMEPFFILGLSATPEESTKILGEPILSVNIDDARGCDFTVHFVAFDPTKEEIDKYNEATVRMEQRAMKVTDGLRKNLSPGRDSIGWYSYDALAINRRQISYLFESRIPIVVRLVKKHEGERTVIFTERTAHAHKIEDALLNAGFDCSMYVNDKNTLKDFQENRTNILIMVKSYREGYDDVKLSVCIMASLSTRPKILTQTMGRTMRQDPDNPNKHAHNYLLLANGTTDHRAKESLDYPRHHFKNDTVQTLFGTGIEEWEGK